MSVPAAFITAIIISATNPLAIKWSGQGSSPLFAAMARVSIALAVCAVLMAVFRKRLEWNREARRVYFAAAMGVFLCLLPTYWAAEYISSGLISVLFGLMPMSIGFLAARFLAEDALSPARLLGMLAGVFGLLVIFGANADASPATAMAITGVIFAVLSQSVSTVWIKALNHPMSALSITTGTLLYSLPPFALAWYLMEGQLPEAISARAAVSTVYLAVAGSALGWVLYFYILKRVCASRLALANLVTPLCALLLGSVLNDETIEQSVWIGTGMILLGLAVYQWGHRFARRAQIGDYTPEQPAEVRESA